MKDKLHVVIMVVILVIIAMIAVLIIASFSGTNEESSGYYPVAQTKWPDNDLTKGFPKFDGDIYSVMKNGTSTAIYIQNVEKTAADKYAAQLASSGVTFKNEDYPKTAQKGDVFITLAYNAENKKFSITFALKTESDIEKSNMTEGSE
jgi:hypothetical protein